MRFKTETLKARSLLSRCTPDQANTAYNLLQRLGTSNLPKSITFVVPDAKPEEISKYMGAQLETKWHGLAAELPCGGQNTAEDVYVAALRSSKNIGVYDSRMQVPLDHDVWNRAVGPYGIKITEEDAQQANSWIARNRQSLEWWILCIVSLITIHLLISNEGWLASAGLAFVLIVSTRGYLNENWAQRFFKFAAIAAITVAPSLTLQLHESKAMLKQLGPNAGELANPTSYLPLEELIEDSEDLALAKELIRLGLCAHGSKAKLQGWPLTIPEAKLLASQWDGNSYTIVVHRYGNCKGKAPAIDDHAAWEALAREVNPEIGKLTELLRNTTDESVPQLLGRFSSSYPELFRM